MKRSGAPRRKQPRDASWIVYERTKPTLGELERVRLEDEEIQRRRELFPLH